MDTVIHPRSTSEPSTHLSALRHRWTGWHRYL